MDEPWEDAVFSDAAALSTASPPPSRSEPSFKRGSYHQHHLFASWNPKEMLSSLNFTALPDWSEIDACDSSREVLLRMERMILVFLTALASSCQRRIQSRELSQWRALLVVAPVLYTNLQEQIGVTKRDLYYLLVRQLPSQHASGECVRHLGEVLRVPRYALGVVAGQRGSIGGLLTYERANDSGEGRCTGWKAHSEHVDMQIPAHERYLGVAPWGQTKGTAGKKCAKFHATCMASPSRSPPLFYLSPRLRAVLVVEKATVYHRLMQEECFRLFPCVVLTSQGFPTVAARRLLANIALAIRELPSGVREEDEEEVGPFQQTSLSSATAPVLVALGDFNPSGVSIIFQYKFGKVGFREDDNGESDKHHHPSTEEGSPLDEQPPLFASSPPSALSTSLGVCRVPDLRWLGLRSHHVLQPVLGLQERTKAAPTFCSPCPCTAFTRRDRVLMDHLIEEVLAIQEVYGDMLSDAVASESNHAVKTKEEVGAAPSPSCSPHKGKQDIRRRKAAKAHKASEASRRSLIIALLAGGTPGRRSYNPLQTNSGRVRYIEQEQRIRAAIALQMEQKKEGNHEKEKRSDNRSVCSRQGGEGVLVRLFEPPRLGSEPRSPASAAPLLCGRAGQSSSLSSFRFLSAWYHELSIMREAGLKVELDAMIDYADKQVDWEGVLRIEGSERGEEAETGGGRTGGAREARRSRPLSWWVYRCIVKEDFI